MRTKARAKKSSASKLVKKQLDELMDFIKFNNLFRSKPRLIHYKGVDGFERTGEHSYQLAMVCWFLNSRFNLGLDPLRLHTYALVHDKPETYDGDTPAFVLYNGAPITPCRIKKAAKESVARARIRREWFELFPEMVESLEAYERQEDEESQFVYAVDKLIACANIRQDDNRTNILLKLGFETTDLYHRPRVSRHAFVLALYEEHFAQILAEQKSKG
jgi:5'-deoxynucleotidase YfbR-like HD superfamily hydrolase